jgi:hypothetical protein
MSEQRDVTWGRLLLKKHPACKPINCRKGLVASVRQVE